MLQLFRLWLGVTEYLFRNPELLDEALDTACDDSTFRSDDLEFTFAARVRLLINSLYNAANTDRHGPTAFHLAISNPTGTDSSGSSSTLRQDSRRHPGWGMR